MKVICVYKTGGDFSRDYVTKLKVAVKKNTIKSHEFICLTDDPEVRSICKVIPLKNNFPGWWSKIELFRPDLPDDNYLFFDLDTVVFRNIDDMIALADNAPGFLMLTGFNKRLPDHPASGIMMGRFPKLSYIYDEFRKDPGAIIYSLRNEKVGMNGDQGWIIRKVGWEVDRIQNYLPSGYIIGKMMWRHKRGLDRAHIIAWSGKPRLHEQKSSELGLIWNSYEES